MSTTLEVQPLPGVAAVLLTVKGAPAGALTITRADSNGTMPVRLLPDQQPINGSLTVRDYEPAVTGPVTYSLQGDVGVVTVTTDLGLHAAVLSTPVRPARRSDAGVVTNMTESRQSSSVVHYVPGRQDPIVIGGPLRKRVGVVTLRLPSYTEAAALRDLAAEGDVVQLRVPGYPGMDWYGRVESRNAPAEVTGEESTDWEVTLDYVEVNAPTAALVGAADWTLADVAATVPTLRDLAAAFPTIRDLAVGP